MKNQERISWQQDFGWWLKDHLLRWLSCSCCFVVLKTKNLSKNKTKKKNKFKSQLEQLGEWSRQKQYQVLQSKSFAVEPLKVCCTSMASTRELSVAFDVKTFFVFLFLLQFRKLQPFGFKLFGGKNKKGANLLLAMEFGNLIQGQNPSVSISTFKFITK